MRTETYDYIVVGGGTAGCVLANRLSANPSVKVALVEAGDVDNYMWIHIPVGYLYCIGNPKVDWCFKTDKQDGLNGRALNYPRGRVLGGCSSINGMIYMRGQARDYDLWCQQGNEGWSWDDVLPYFTKSEDNHVHSSGPYHGTGGELRVEKQRLRWDILDAFQEAANQYGIKPVDDFNTGDNEGCGYFSVNQKQGKRWSSATAFLNPVKARKNLRILTKTQVKSLRMDGRKVEGLTCTGRNGELVIDARKEVVLCAGAIGSPQILQVSGIGPSNVLQEAGIETRHELSGVGENLQDHLQIRCAFKVHGVKTLNESSSSLLGKAKIGLEYLMHKSGPMAMAPSQMGVFAKTDPGFETPNVEFHVQPLSLDKFGEPLHPFPAFTASVCNLRPESRGTVKIVSPDPLAKPSIDPNYLSTENDRKVAAESIRLARSIVRQPALFRYRPEEFLPGQKFVSDEKLAKAAGDISTTIFHPAGTCKMGNSQDAVVDSRLRVHGIEGLRVVDASIMPTITSGNTNAPVVMIAEKAADMICEDAKT